MIEAKISIAQNAPEDTQEPITVAETSAMALIRRNFALVTDTESHEEIPDSVRKGRVSGWTSAEVHSVLRPRSLPVGRIRNLGKTLCALSSHHETISSQAGDDH